MTAAKSSSALCRTVCMASSPSPMDLPPEGSDPGSETTAVLVKRAGATSHAAVNDTRITTGNAVGSATGTVRGTATVRGTGNGRGSTDIVNGIRGANGEDQDRQRTTHRHVWATTRTASAFSASPSPSSLLLCLSLLVNLGIGT